MSVSGWLTLLLVVVAVYAIVISRLYWRTRKRIRRQLPMRMTPSASDNDKERRLQEKADEALRLTQNFQKFVPRQFVEHFAKHGQNSLELGYADEDDVAILTCDIRGFTGLSERMRPQELMNFLNSYFLRMNDPIHHNNGFIDKFIGDAILALFDHPGGTNQEKAKDAINAAIDLRKALAIYNDHRARSGYSAINIGVGINFGPVIFGTVGSDDRMDTTVIGDSVNIAFRLESLAPKYNADIIVSAQTLDVVDDDKAYTTRLIDWVKVKGRQTPIEIYEILDHLSAQERDKRLSIQPHIAAGIQCRIEQNWDAALEHFKRAQEIIPGDILSRHHIQVCEHYRLMNLGQHWDGALFPG